MQRHVHLLHCIYCLFKCIYLYLTGRRKIYCNYSVRNNLGIKFTLKFSLLKLPVLTLSSAVHPHFSSIFPLSVFTSSSLFSSFLHFLFHCPPLLRFSFFLCNFYFLHNFFVYLSSFSFLYFFFFISHFVFIYFTPFCLLFLTFSPAHLFLPFSSCFS